MFTTTAAVKQELGVVHHAVRVVEVVLVLGQGSNGDNLEKNHDGPVHSEEHNDASLNEVAFSEGQDIMNYNT